MTFPKISIIIPVYNVERYLRECLDSCINQTLKDIEIICVDDCSTDNSYNILKEYLDKDSRIQIFRQEQNRKQGTARNRGLKIATGEYIWFIDSDDYIDTKACQILYNTIKEFDIDLLCFSALIFAEKNGFRKFSYSNYFQGIQINKIYHPKKTWYDLQFSNLNVSPCMYLTKKSVVEKFRFREDVFHEDTDFTPILFASINSFCFIPYSAYFYRTNQCSTTQTPISKKRLEDFIEALSSLNQFAINNRIKQNHFIFHYATWLTNNIFKILQSNPAMNPNNCDKFLKLKKKYQLQKYSLKRFLGKVEGKICGQKY